MGDETDKLGGKLKETAGKATGDDQLEAEGKADQAKGDAKESLEKAKDAFDNITR
jgi:uncharacterized protein YjbJ (UPF0337 family)